MACSPLPCIIYFVEEDISINVYSINGHLLKVIKEDSIILLPPTIIYNSVFDMLLAYILNNELVIRELPNLEKVIGKLFDRKVTAFSMSKNGSFGLIGYEDGDFSFIHPESLSNKNE